MKENVSGCYWNLLQITFNETFGTVTRLLGRLTISSSYGATPLALGLIVRDGDLSAQCHSCQFACQQRVQKTFPGPVYFRSEDGIVWLWYSLVNVYMWLTISSCYSSILLALGLIGRDCGLSTLCQNSAKNVSWTWLSLLRDGVVWPLTMAFTGKFVYIYIKGMKRTKGLKLRVISCSIEYFH